MFVAATGQTDNSPLTQTLTLPFFSPFFQTTISKVMNRESNVLLKWQHLYSYYIPLDLGVFSSPILFCVFHLITAFGFYLT